MGNGDQKLNVEISTHAELTALRAYEAQLVRQISAAKAVGDSYKTLEIELDGVRSRLGEFNLFQKITAEITDFASKIPGVGALVNSLNGSFLSVATGVGVFKKTADLVHEATVAFEQAEQRLVGLRAALALTGQFTGANEAAVRSLVDAQKQYAIAGSESQPVIETLLKLGRVHVSDLEKEFNAVKGLAALTGGDLQSASIMWSKALEGNTMMLQRWMPELKTAKDAEEKLALARTRLTDAAKAFDAQSETDIGAHKKLTGALGDLMSRLGGVINTVVPYGDAVRTAAKVAGDLAAALPAIESAVKPVNSALAKAGAVSDAVAASFASLGSKAANVLGETGDGGLVAALDDVSQKADATNKKLEETLRLQNEFRDATTASKVAKLRMEEAAALSKETTPEGRRVIEAQFAEKRRQIEDANKLEKLQAERASDQEQFANTQAQAAPFVSARQKYQDAQTSAHQDLDQFRGKYASEGFAQTDSALIAKYDATAAELKKVQGYLATLPVLSSSSIEAGEARAKLPGLETAEKSQRLEAQRAKDRVARQAALQQAADTADKEYSDFTTQKRAAFGNQNVNEVIEKLNTAAAALATKIELLDSKITAASDTSAADAAISQGKVKEAGEAKDKTAAEAARRQQQADLDAQRKAEVAKPTTGPDAFSADTFSKILRQHADVQAKGDPAALKDLLETADKEFTAELVRRARAILKQNGDKAALQNFPDATKGRDAQNDAANAVLNPVPHAVIPPKPVRRKRETTTEFDNRIADWNADKAALDLAAWRTRQANAQIPSAQPDSAPKANVQNGAQPPANNDLPVPQEMPAPPKPLDVSQITGALQGYFAANEAQHVQTDAEIAALSKIITGHTTALDNLKGNVREVQNS